MIYISCDYGYTHMFIHEITVTRTGVVQKDSTEILGFECGGQQWVHEVGDKHTHIYIL